MKNLRQIFVALLLLFVGTTAMAQSQSDNIDGNTTTAVRADVNGDGVVNEADIAEIIAIMKNAGGIAEQPKYYWYVARTDPSTMTSISPIVTDTTSPGWRLIGTTLPSSETKLFDESNAVNFGSQVIHYIAIPKQTLKLTLQRKII